MAGRKIQFLTVRMSKVVTGMITLVAVAAVAVGAMVFIIVKESK